MAHTRLRGLTLAPTLTLAPALTLALVLALYRNEARSEGEQRVVVRGAWWLPGAALAALALLLNALHQLWHLLLTGCGAGPALWRQTSDLEPEEEDELRRMVAKGCDSLASKYDFGMGLTASWKVRQAATPCDPGCNPVCPRLLHPYMPHRLVEGAQPAVRGGVGGPSAAAPGGAQGLQSDAALSRHQQGRGTCAEALAPPSQGPCILSTRTRAARPHLSTPPPLRAAPITLTQPSPLPSRCGHAPSSPPRCQAPWLG